MAKRPVFVSISEPPFFKMVEVEFQFYNGFAISQKQKSIKSLHDSFIKTHPDSQILEISSKGWEEISKNLSAFFLPYELNGKKTVVECVFQGSKVFENGGPYIDMYWKEPWVVKKDERLKESGKIIAFNLDGCQFSNEPKDFFYNWIYINALWQDQELLGRAMTYDAFTDIEFNPEKSLNCQARSVAIAKGLSMAGLLNESIKSKESFLQRVYSKTKANEEGKQLSLFD